MHNRTNLITAIEIDLRLPSMFAGKKAFDRLTWAFKNVLDSSLTWLFYDLRSPNLEGGVKNALSTHSPTIKTVKPERFDLKNALVPSFKPLQAEDSDHATELLEWLSLAMARSPRVLRGNDGVDPYLCRYRPDGKPADLVLLQWHGFAPSAFVQKILLAAMKASVGDDGWFALGGTASQGKGYMALRDGGEGMTWNYSD
jgi:ribonuclease P/MRP protein subunit RPP40